MSIGSAALEGAGLGARGGAIVGAFFGPEGIPVGAAIGGIGGAIAGGVAGWYGSEWLANHMSNAHEEAQAKSKAETTTYVCASCASPCAALASGIPGSKYRGGAHGSTKRPKGDGLDSHHTPADSVSPLPRDASPAIQMDPADHAQTASNGRMPGSALYRARQEALIEDGSFMGAVAMDIADVHAKFGSKYDSALAQMTAYAECLKRNGIVK